ncbi:hypothetical protein MNBD_GAMMA03-1937 [hydrothermal vent metagenome]|uniref:Uncharacterized protein n=1 Tax=hydrothermal vent metagenome TaxID=652676 RepID=A0A3B0WEP7_9ZZZZ
MLLEALKKAAEDKKKALESSEQSPKKTIDSGSDDLLTSKKVMPDIAQKQTSSLSSSSDENIQLPSDIVGVTNKNHSADEKKLSSFQELVEDDGASQSSLKLTLDNSLIQESSSTNLGANSRSPKSSTDDEQPKLKLVLEETVVEQNINDKTTLTDDFEPVMTKGESSELIDSDVVHDNKEYETAQESDVSDILNKKSEKEHHAVKEECDELSLSEQKINLEDDIKPVGDVSGQYINNALDEGVIPLKKAAKKEKTPGGVVEESQKYESAVNSLTMASTLKSKKIESEEESESFKWSLDSLPGYLKLGKGENKKSSAALNPILVSGALSDDPSRNSRQSSPKLILILLMMLFFIGIIFYGILYYQTEYEAVENNMKKYNLVKAQISEKEAKDMTVSIDENIEQTTRDLPVSSKKIEDVYSEGGVDGKEVVDIIELQSSESKEGVKSLNKERTSLLEKNPVTPMSSASNIVRPVNKISQNSASNASPRSDSVAHIASSPVIYRKNIENNAAKKATIVVHTEKAILAEAYLSYKQESYTAAQQAFESVLKINPSNEFALIGLGNTAVTEQNYLLAMEYYQQALLAHPSSLNAFEAIANIAGFIVLNEEWKTSLLGMVLDYPESAILQYALGNLYVGEQDWLAAQNAYFQAVSLEPENANYIVNLAVSLDQLGKYKLATKYYTEALSLIGIQAVNFDEAEVKNRLITIRQFIAEKNL